MFFSKLALFAVATFAVFVAALPKPGGINGSCGGQIYCCESYHHASSDAAQEKTLLGVVIPAGASAGLTCTPISVLALQKSTCRTQTSCCTGNSFNGGAVVLGCSPTGAGV